jgi:hypothetical protein
MLVFVVTKFYQCWGEHEVDMEGIFETEASAKRYVDKAKFEPFNSEHDALFIIDCHEIQK